MIMFVGNTERSSAAVTHEMILKSYITIIFRTIFFWWIYFPVFKHACLPANSITRC